MTKNERIAALEARVEQLEKQLRELVSKLVEALAPKPVFPPALPEPYRIEPTPNPWPQMIPPLIGEPSWKLPLETITIQSNTEGLEALWR